MQQPDQGVGDARVSDELGHGIKNRRVIVIEADDHAAPDMQAVLLDAMNALKQRARLPCSSEHDDAQQTAIA